MEKRYNLLYEPWIKVMDQRLTVSELSLIDVLRNSHKIKALAGDTPLQNFAVERLLLAIAITIFYKYDENGKYALLNDDEECDFDESEEVEELVMSRWSSYYKLGKFPDGIVEEYLKQFEDRFWLFHPETPFYQVPSSVLINDKKYGTEYSTKCMLGNIKESNNEYTKYHFSMASGKNLEDISDAELARWLVHLMSYSVNIKKPTGIGKGRLGCLGSIKVEGNNLFNELMLNLVPININGLNIALWGEPKPTWEKELNKTSGVEISPPNNLPELYTIQSRKIVLNQEDGIYKGGYVMGGGEYYSLKDDPVEQMTLWKKNKDNQIEPKTHELFVQSWREFDPLVGVRDSVKKPGLVCWIEKILEQNRKFLPSLVTFVFNGMHYDSNGSSYVNYTWDKISLSSEVLNDVGKDWIEIISSEIEKCEKVSKDLYEKFSNVIAKIYDLEDKQKKKINAKLSHNFFNSIDNKFRDWLVTIEPGKTNKNDKQEEWGKIARRIANDVVLNYIDELNLNYKICVDKKSNFLSIPYAYNKFKKELYTMYPVIDRKDSQ